MRFRQARRRGDANTAGDGLVSVLAFCGTVFCGSAAVARRRRVAAAEATIFRRINRTTELIEAPTWAVMQAGSLGAVAVASSVTAARGGRRAATVTLVSGAGVWAAMKLVKPVVRRGRPAVYLADVRIRGVPQNGFGYPSGHAAVATTLALTTTAGGCPRCLALSVAAAVGAARIYSGAHLPLDVVGGFAAGGVAGLLGRRVIAR